jgi:hypothetical protein
VKRCSVLSVGSSSIGQEVAASDDLGGCLQAADEWNRVQCRVGGAAHETLAADRRGHRRERERGPYPRNRTAEAASHPPLSVAQRLLLDRHATLESKARTMAFRLFPVRGGAIRRRDCHQLGMGGLMSLDQRFGPRKRVGIAAAKDGVGFDQARL